MNITIAEPIASVEAAVTKIRLLRDITLISFTVLVFDHLLTLQDEIEYIWKRRMTPFSVLFLFNRYLTPSAFLVYVVLNFSYVSEGCKIGEEEYQPPVICTKAHKSAVEIEVVLLVFSMATMLIAEAMITLRAYAVYQNNQLILWLLLPICIAHAALMGVGFRGAALPATGAGLGVQVLKSSNGIRERFDIPVVKLPMDAGIMFIAPAVLFDTITGGLLTLGMYYRRSGASHKHMPLTKLIIQDGLLYFAVVFANNVAWILVHVFESNKLSMALIAFVPLEIWSACLMITMIGHLTLNLRMYDPVANNELTFEVMTMRFRSPRQHTSTVESHRDSSQDGA